MIPFDPPRDEERDEHRYRWIRNNVMRVRELLKDWDATLTPQHFDSVINSHMREEPKPL